MSEGTFNGVPFLIDPESVAFHFDLKSSQTNTVGGKVVQVWGTYLSNLSVTGSFGLGGWQAQSDFLNSMIGVVSGQLGTPDGTGAITNGPPVRFTFPPRDWDFMVYLLDYNQPNSTLSVALDNSIVNYQWELTLFVYQDNGALQPITQASLLQYLQHLSAGLGWVPNQYNNVTGTPTIIPMATTTPGDTNSGAPTTPTPTVPVPNAGRKTYTKAG